VIGRRHGFDLPRRVYGPELMATFCKQNRIKGLPAFFLRGAPGVAEDLASQFVSRFSGMVVRELTALRFVRRLRRISRIIHAIEGAQPDIVWVDEHSQAGALDVRASRSLKRPSFGWGRRRLRFPHRACYTSAGLDGRSWLGMVIPAFVEPRRLWRRYLVMERNLRRLHCLNYWSEESSLTAGRGGTLLVAAAT